VTYRSGPTTEECKTYEIRHAQSDCRTGELLRQMRGLWFICEVKMFPTQFAKGESPLRFDFGERRHINRSQARRIYGREVYCIAKRQLSRRELKRNGLHPSAFSSSPDARPFSQVNPACQQRSRTVEVMAGCRVRCAWEYFCDANTGDSQDFTDLVAAVRLRLRVAFGLQTLIVKLRLLPGWNTVQVRGDPPSNERRMPSIGLAKEDFPRSGSRLWMAAMTCSTHT
jgi:hypothetical protein